MGLRVRRLALLAFVAAAWLGLTMPGVPSARPDRDSNHRSEKRDRDKGGDDAESDGDEAEDPDAPEEDPDAGEPDDPEAGVEGQEPEEGAGGEEDCVDRAFAQSEGKADEEADEEGEESEARAAKRKRKRDREGGGGREQDVVEGSYIVVYDESVEGPKRKTDELEDECDVEVDLRYSRVLKGFSAELSDEEVEELEEERDVEAVVPDRRVRADGFVPLASGDSAPTGVRRMAAGTTSTARQASGAKVAVIDSGVDLDHPDLNVTAGKDCVPDDRTSTDDDHGHGTHVAGTIGARNNGSGVVGVAPNTSLLAVKVLDSTGAGFDSWIICGIEWVTATRSDGDSSNDISVANLSLGGVGGAVRSCGQTTDPLHKAICNSTAAGVTYVVAAGNEGWDFDYPSAPDTPAAFPEVLTVTAMADSDGRGGGEGLGCSGETDDRHAGFSNFAYTDQGKAHTIAAPGVCIRSTLRGGGHGNMSGTSMASPHVAGAVALCLSEGGADGPCKGKTPAQIIAHMRAQAEAQRQAAPSFGFTGDPASPVGSPTEYFGHLVFPGVATTVEPSAGPTTTTVAASSYTVDTGSWRSGSAASLQADDGNLLQVDSGGSKKKRVVGWSGGFTNVPNSAQSFQVTYSGGNSRSCAQTLAIFRWTTNSWVTLDSRSVAGETRLVKSVPGTMSDYVHTASGPGTVVVRVSCSRKKKGFSSQGDLMLLTYTTP
jgi:subtilisin family serine protease